MEQRWLSPKAYGVKYGATAETVIKWCKEGRVRFTVVNGRYRVFDAPPQPEGTYSQATTPAASESDKPREPTELEKLGAERSVLEARAAVLKARSEVEGWEKEEADLADMRDEVVTGVNRLMQIDASTRRNVASAKALEKAEKRVRDVEVQSTRRVRENEARIAKDNAEAVTYQTGVRAEAEAERDDMLAGARVEAKEIVRQAEEKGRAIRAFSEGNPGLVSEPKPTERGYFFRDKDVEHMVIVWAFRVAIVAAAGTAFWQLLSLIGG